MQPIPTPRVLDPERVLANDRDELTVDHEARANLLDEALHQSCDYAQQLWQDLDGLRGYLLTSLPPDPRAPGPNPTASAAPTGPEDTQGWDSWINAYASVTSVLCGPYGDSGYGLSEARREADLRRSAPVLAVSAHHPQVFGGPAGSASAPAGGPSATAESLPAPDGHKAPTGPHRLHTAVTVVLAVLALRGLRSRRPTRPLP